MDSALCSQYGALCIPSTISVTCRVPRLHSNFNPSSLTFSSNGSTRCTKLGHAFSPVISALNKCSIPSENDKDDRKFLVRGMGGASVVLACVLGIMNCNYKFTAMAIASARPGYQNVSSFENQDRIQPKSAKEILHSLLVMNEHVAVKEHVVSRSLNIFKTKKLLDVPADEPSFKQCEKLKIKAAELIKAGMCDEAEQQLRDILRNQKYKPEGAYNVEMVLVAVLIFQGKYREASECQCLTPPPDAPSDGRVPLYKAIIHTMLDQNEEAKKCWDEFVGLLDNQDLPMSPLSSGSSKHKSKKKF